MLMLARWAAIVPTVTAGGCCCIQLKMYGSETGVIYSLCMMLLEWLNQEDDVCGQTDWCGCNLLDLYLRVVLFKSRVGHRLPAWGYCLFLSVSKQTHVQCLDYATHTHTHTHTHITHTHTHTPHAHTHTRACLLPDIRKLNVHKFGCPSVLCSLL
jgi:hypothetical protein